MTEATTATPIKFKEPGCLISRVCYQCKWWQSQRRSSDVFGNCHLKDRLRQDFEQNRDLVPPIWWPRFRRIKTPRHFSCVQFEIVGIFHLVASLHSDWGVTAVFPDIEWNDRQTLVTGLDKEQAKELCGFLNAGIRRLFGCEKT